MESPYKPESDPYPTTSRIRDWQWAMFKVASSTVYCCKFPAKFNYFIAQIFQPEKCVQINRKPHLAIFFSWQIQMKLFSRVVYYYSTYESSQIPLYHYFKQAPNLQLFFLPHFPARNFFHRIIIHIQLWISNCHYTVCTILYTLREK